MKVLGAGWSARITSGGDLVQLSLALPGAIYTGGNPNLAASYTCSSRPQYTNPFLLNGQRG